MKKLLLVLLNIIAISAIAQNHVPSFEEVISLHGVGTVEISPDGKSVAFTVQKTDWNENRYDNEIWLSKEGNKPFPLTNNPKNSSTSPLFSPDGKWISFLSDRGNKNQIYVVRYEGGEAWPVTNEKKVFHTINGILMAED